MGGLLNILSLSGFAALTIKEIIMIVIAIILIYLAIFKDAEPLLMLPIGFGVLLANLPLSGIADPPNGFFYIIYKSLVETELLPIIIFMGIGAMTDFGPLIANPWTMLMGAGAQFGIFIALLFSLLLGFNIKEAASIGIIGGADGPIAIYTTVKLAPHLLGPIAVAAYTYMSMVPIIQPPIMRLLTTKKERSVVMEQLRPVSRLEK